MSSITREERLRAAQEKLKKFRDARNNPASPIASEVINNEGKIQESQGYESDMKTDGAENSSLLNSSLSHQMTEPGVFARDLHQQLVNMSYENDALRAKCQNLEERISTERSIAQEQLQSANSSKEKEYNRFMEQIRSRDQKIGLLEAEQTEVKARLSHFEKLADKVHHDTAQHSEVELNLTTQIADLKMRLTDLLGENNRLKDGKNELITKLEHYTGLYEAERSKNGQLQSDLAHLRDQLSDQVSKSTELQNKLLASEQQSGSDQSDSYSIVSMGDSQLRKEHELLQQTHRNEMQNYELCLQQAESSKTSLIKQHAEAIGLLEHTLAEEKYLCDTLKRRVSDLEELNQKSFGKVSLLPIAADDSPPTVIETPEHKMANMDRLSISPVSHMSTKVEDAPCNEELPNADEWLFIKAAHTQLEARYMELRDENVQLREEKSRLEEICAQLEMESSTVEDYISMFTHRRNCAQKRAKEREQILANLTRERSVIRAKLCELLQERELLTKPTDDDATTAFLSHLDQMFSDLQVNEMSELPQPQFNWESPNDEEYEMQSTSDKDALQLLRKNPILQQKLFPPDMPHCQCCRGNLIDV